MIVPVPRGEEKKTKLPFQQFTHKTKNGSLKKKSIKSENEGGKGLILYYLIVRFRNLRPNNFQERHCQCYLMIEDELQNCQTGEYRWGRGLNDVTRFPGKVVCMQTCSIIPLVGYMYSLRGSPLYEDHPAPPILLPLTPPPRMPHYSFPYFRP